jgi:hypothetical protein
VQVQIEGCILWLRAIDSTGAMVDQTTRAKCPPGVFLPLLVR